MAGQLGVEGSENTNDDEEDRVLYEVKEDLRLCAFFFNDTATTEIYTLSLHDALPISDF